MKSLSSGNVALTSFALEQKQSIWYGSFAKRPLTPDIENAHLIKKLTSRRFFLFKNSIKTSINPFKEFTLQPQ